MKFYQRVDDKLDYRWDWSKWLDEGDLISVFEVTASGDVVLSNQAVTGTEVTVWVTGGTPGSRAVLSCQITTTQGRIKTTSLIIDVE